MLSRGLACRNVATRFLKEAAAVSSRVVVATHSRSLSTIEGGRTQRSLQEEAETFTSLLRKWNPQAYQNVDRVHKSKVQEKEGKISLAKQLREWNQAAYEKVDEEHRLAAERAAEVGNFNPRQVKGVFWTDAQGRDHIHRIQKPKPTDGAPA
mmetsp:Transcript_61225/g.144101  ORF Transcript_61225/g.144101 Transcript_61225/m.144101 type:complete len:152 (+) Transcript_61225:216-671(+)|eukprot:CAMPEP_0177737904 /NCGR_PEP_ID=MMETSP0484_2-20121128/26146_1 /TAXON_ID=354590 /ORGANISM="Rhodomonas lens, Strain RHODO" /LENGTH=151 /DNA_ID=CAMNT_0019251741 /DNA_START=207 /DNA_END=662 /DNA_ORIENTATION=+